MAQIKRILVANHTHHDIGFNDYQDVCFRQHGEFVRDALDLIEATASREPASQYRWVCEVTGPLVRYLKEAGPAEVERFRYWQERGAIDVAAMQYNLTPLLSPEQMRRSLYPVRILREEMGIDVQTAMQDDVNGVSWIFADLLPSIGIDFLTMAINQSRGRAPRPFPGAFWWQGPAGGRLLTWNGFHYLFGRSQAKLGDWRFVDESLPYYLDALEESDTFPYDFLYVESTHPMRVDNGPPDVRMADFVREWNDRGREPRIEFSTPRLFRQELETHGTAGLPTVRGDWTDWWADGAGSSAYETGINRATHEVLASAEVLAAWVVASGRSPQFGKELVEKTYEAMSLFDEHTWGGFSSIDAPESLFTRAQWNRKASFAYQAAMESHDMLTRSARQLADAHAERAVEGRFDLGDLGSDRAYPTDDEGELLVFNTLPFERTVNVEVPEFRAGGAPAGMLESFFPRDVPWGGPPTSDLATVRVTVPGFGYAFIHPSDHAEADDLVASGTSIENEFYRVEVDPRTGQISSWYDKQLSHEFADTGDLGGFGGYLHETVDSALGRDALFVNDFSDWDFGHWVKNPPFDRAGASTVECSPARIEAGDAIIDDRDHGARNSSCHLPDQPPDEDEDPARRLAARQGTPDGPRVGLHPLPREARRARVCRRPQRHAGPAERRPARRLGLRLVPDTPLDGRERRDARCDGRLARRPAHATGRHHDEQGRRPGRAGTPGARVVGAEQSLDGELQGEPGRSDPAALPLHDARREVRSRGRQPVRTRGVRGACRASRLQTDRSCVRNPLRIAGSARDRGAPEGGHLRRRADPATQEHHDCRRADTARPSAIERNRLSRRPARAADRPGDDGLVSGAADSSLR